MREDRTPIDPGYRHDDIEKDRLQIHRSQNRKIKRRGLLRNYQYTLSMEARTGCQQPQGPSETRECVLGSMRSRHAYAAPG